MSAGHPHTRPNEKHHDELPKLLAEPAVAQALARHVRVDHSYDLPYLAGYSQDGATIYLDRHFPSHLMVGGKLLAVHVPIVTHERTEKALIDGKGYDYQSAHEYATCAEHEQVRQLGFKPYQYEDALEPFIKADEVKKLERVPPDLDLTPYIDEKDKSVLARLRAAGAKGAGKAQAGIAQPQQNQRTG